LYLKFDVFPTGGIESPG
jgi:hypothetical protein